MCICSAPLASIASIHPTVSGPLPRCGFKKCSALESTNTRGYLCKRSLQLHKEPDHFFLFTEMDFVGSRLKKYLLITGRTKLIRMIQLLAQWKDLLLYLSNDHFVLPNGSKLQKVDGGEWGVYVHRICHTKNFFPDQALVYP